MSLTSLRVGDQHAANTIGMQISAAVPELRITFSAGITAYRSGEPMDEAIERADHALYAAKAAGRDTWRWALAAH